MKLVSLLLFLLIPFSTQGYFTRNHTIQRRPRIARRARFHVQPVRMQQEVEAIDNLSYAIGCCCACPALAIIGAYVMYKVWRRHR